jgi:hypothetical protein
MKAILRLLIFVLVPTAFAEPFQNGSFELQLTGWNLESSGTDYVGNPPPPFGVSDGTMCMIFNPSQVNGVGRLWQTFDTEVGQTYLVQFTFGAYGEVFGYPQSIQSDVRDGASPSSGAELFDPASPSGHAGSNNGLSITDTGTAMLVTDTQGDSNPPGQFSYKFTALSGASTIVFSDMTGVNGQFTDGHLDFVRIVPEPTTALLFVLGMIGISFRRKQVRRIAS